MPEMKQAPAPTASRSAQRPGQSPGTARAGLKQQVSGLGYEEGAAALSPRMAPGAPAAPSRGAQAKPPAGKAGWWSSTKGWFQRSAKAVGDRYDQVTSAVGRGVKKGVQAGRDLAEAWQATSVQAKDGVYRLHTDLDEIQDLAPGTRQALQLDHDAKGANEVDATFDKKTGVLSIQAPNLVLKGIQSGRLSSGPAVIRGVSIQLTNHGGGVPLLDKALPKWSPVKDAPDNFSVRVQVQGATVQGIVFDSPKGPVRVQEMDLSAFELHAANPGGGVPFADKVADHIQAGFSVGGVVLRGVSGAGAEAKGIEVQRAGLDLDQDRRTADLRAGRIAADRASYQGNRVTGTEARDLDAHVRAAGAGGKLASADRQPGAVMADVTVGGMKVTDLDAGGAHVGAASASGVRAGYDPSRGAASLSADRASVAGLDTGRVDARSASVTGLRASGTLGAGARTADVSVAGASAQGLDVNGNRVGNVEVERAAARYREASRKLDATVAALRAKGIDTAKLDAGTLTATDLRAGVGGGGAYDASLGSVSATGVDTDRVDAGSVSASGITASGRGRAVKVGVARAGARDVEVEDAGTVKAVDVAGARGGVAADGSYVASLDRASATGAETSRWSVGQAEVGGVSAAGRGRAVDAALQSAGARDIRVQGAGAVESVEAGGARFRTGADGSYGGSVARASAAGVDTRKLDAGRVDLADLQVDGQGRAVAGSLGSGTARDLDVAGVGTVKSAGVTGVRGARAAGGAVSGSLDQAEVRGVQGKVGLEAGRVSDLSVTADPAARSGTVGLGKAEVTGLSAGSVGASSAEVHGVAGRLAGGRTADLSVAGASGSGLVVPKGGATEARVEGLDVHAGRAGGGTLLDRDVAKDLELRASLGEAAAKGIRAGKTSASDAEVQDLLVQYAAAKQEVAAAAGRLQAGGVESATPVGTVRAGSVQGTGLSARAAPGVTDVSGRTLSAGDLSLRSGGTPAAAGGQGISVPAGRGGAPTAKGGASTAARPPLDITGLSSTAAAAVRDAEVRLQVPMRAGEYGKGVGKVGVDEGAHASLSFSVKDGIIQPDGTRIEFSKGLDALAWIRARGLYLTRDGKVKVDLAGFFDINVAGAVTGDGHNRIPLKLTDLVEVLNRRRAEAAGATPSSGSRSGAAGATGSSRTAARAGGPATSAPAAKGPRSLADAFDLAGTTGSLSVGLREGPVAVGNNRLELEKGRPGSNAIQAATTGNQELVASFVEFLVKSLDLDLGGAKLHAGKTVAQGGRADLKPGKAGSGIQVNGTVGSIRTEDFRATRRK